MLGSREEGEDVVQHTFAAAHRALLGEERPIALKPWLYTIARNRCMSVLRARREVPSESCEPATAGLAEEVERRAELRELLADVAGLPAEQRTALLLAEVADLSHAEAAKVLGCEVARVKALVYRARQGLLERRDARATPCDEIREQLSTLRGGALRRSELRHHLRACSGCRAFRDEVKRQRSQLAVALPVIPSLGLKSSVLGAVGLGGGSAGGATALAALGAGSVGPVSGGALAKIAVVGALAGGGLAAGDAALDRGAPERPPQAPVRVAAPAPEPVRPLPDLRSGRPIAPGGGSRARTGAPVRVTPHGRGPAGSRPPATGRPANPAAPPSHARGTPAFKPGGAKLDRKPAPQARGRVTTPPAGAPVRRGPPDEGRTPGEPKSERATAPTEPG
jgi:RNA polymerase sigma factor (sigma-70 family)